ncbi:hypothetical protein MTR67_002924 [Solanum verrucosum]|uniref:Uncharacterized protein n=1 Tax=Solanum verrucosum TaxID=315347 RepID=A0AAF0PR31_SOLVR|nr:hypothetical protein MTR67_002924 [Solanum verrucosum]
MLRSNEIQVVKVQLRNHLEEATWKTELDMRTWWHAFRGGRHCLSLCDYGPVAAFVVTKSPDLYIRVPRVVLVEGQLYFPLHLLALDHVHEGLTSLSSIFVGLTPHLERVSLSDLHNGMGPFHSRRPIHWQICCISHF